MFVGYDVTEELGRDEFHALLRGRRQADGAPVLIKLALHEPPRPVDLAGLKHEFAVLQALEVAGVPRPGAVVQDAKCCALVTDNADGWPLASPRLKAAPDPAVTLRTAVALAQIVAGIHRSGVVHYRLNPSSILLDVHLAAVHLIDFSAAAGDSPELRLRFQRQPSRRELAYIAPEQTGRMNRRADYRADFYSLGAVLYELLTGFPPFRSEDPLELIHWHMAKIPAAPAELKPDVPPALSAIVMKLLAKTPEQRYQSGAGLCADLERCAREWRARGRISVFPLARLDLPERFAIPQHLYGREAAVAQLLQAYDRCPQGRSALVLVSGPAGIGKTSVIEQLHQPVVDGGGSFVSGKFDQVTRDIPYGALIQALRRLVQRLLTEEPEGQQRWRERLSEALGANAGVVAEVLPEIEWILGKTEAPAPLPPVEAQNRFAFAFRKLLAALAAPERPLVLFLDDLQWADPATLTLLTALLESPDARGLLLIGAYRDNEVDEQHPLQRTVAALQDAAVELQSVQLEALGIGDLSALVADALHCDPDQARPLAQVLLAKTAGNPFFAIQFLKTLHQEGLVAIDPKERRWMYDLGGIRGAAMTDNVIDLMTRKLNRLAAGTQAMLQLAACIGGRFDLATLATAAACPQEDARADLDEALAEGLIVPVRESGEEDGEVGTLCFLHDRVQQAAYAQIAAERRPQVHLEVGRLLMQHWDREGPEDRLFDIVGHLNAGMALIAERAQRLEAASLNLEAGQKAKSSTAYRAALGYFEVGMNLLDALSWETEYELAFTLHLQSAECNYLCGRFDDAERLWAVLLARARSRLDRAKVHNLKLLQYESQSRYDEAIRVGEEALALFGLSFPGSREARQDALGTHADRITALVAGSDASELAEAPAMADAELRMLMKLLASLHTSCYLSGDKTLTMLNTAHMVELSLTHGITQESAYAFALYAAMLLVPVQRNYRSANEFGELALRINDRFPDPAIRARVLMNLGWAVSLWRQPMSEAIRISLEAFRLGNENGMFQEATYALFNHCWLTLLSGPELGAFQEACSPNAEYATRVKMNHFRAAPQTILQWGLALQGRTEHPTSFTDAGFDEQAFRDAYRGQPLFEMFYFVAKTAVLYTFEDYRGALQAAGCAQRIVADFPGTIWDVLTVYYHGLTVAALYPEFSAREREQADAALANASAWMRRLAENAPGSFRDHHLILSAEIARLLGKDTVAMALYEDAIGFAKDCPRERATAAELYARFWNRRGNARIAGLYLREARQLYADWGADAKVRQLDERYAELMRKSLIPGIPGALSRVPSEGEEYRDVLDIGSVLKAAHAISAEVVLQDFLKQVLRIAIENAGARRGLLIDERNGALFVAAEGSIDRDEFVVPPSKPLSSNPPVCSSAVVNYVRSTGQSVVLADAAREGQFAGDPYIASTLPRSVLCMPVVHQAKFSAILYLENNLASGAFIAQRIEVLRILMAQAAISLENARLFDSLKQENAQRRFAEQALRQALTEVGELKDRLEEENVYLRRDLVANISHDLRTPLAVLHGYLETLLLKEADLSPEKRRAYLDIAFRQSNRLGGLISQLFELVKLDINDVKVEPEPLQVCELVQDIVRKFELVARQKDVSLTTELGANVPLALADVGLIERALDNLIQNALQHVPAGGEVCVAVQADERQVRLQVRDTGTGIRDEDLPHIFERFYRSDKARSARNEGAGLGLAITKRILDLHHSEIRVTSTPAVGTCFSFGLPAATGGAVERPGG